MMLKWTCFAALFFALVGCDGGDQGADAARTDAGGPVADMDASEPSDELDASTDDDTMPDSSTQDSGPTEDVADADADPASCTAPDGCAAGRYLGQFSGDQAAFNAQLGAEGTTSEWLLLRVTEDSNATQELAVQVTMTPLDGGNYDLFAYFTEDDMACDLITANLSATNASSQPEELVFGWSDRFAGNDSRTVALEVRHVDGDCTGWELDVRAP